MSAPLLEVRDLSVEIVTGKEKLRVVEGASFSIARGECVGLVGESGSGKSMSAFAILNLFPSPQARIAGGDILLEGRSLRGLSPREWRQVRGAQIGMVFQDPSSYLDPLIPVGRQVAETLRAHGRNEGTEARVLELLDLMELPSAAEVARKYPHELSGGMRQRILIAAALALRPALLIADEPTTALDVTVQAGILNLLTRLRAELDLGILLITHDLGVVARIAHRVSVMYAGEVVESGPTAELFANPQHPYTRGLLTCIPVPGKVKRDEPLGSIPGVVPRIPPGYVGCAFRDRCPHAHAECDGAIPRRAAGPGHEVLCTLPAGWIGQQAA